jgi:hypothetical protein
MKSSTETAAYDLINEILTSLNNKNEVGGFLKLKKAFDCVQHEILLAKLQYYGITDNFLIKSFLMNRYQKVQIKEYKNNNNESDWGIIRQGVPQWSILGPLFFLLYINDLSKVFKFSY